MLAASTIIAKILGACYRIPLTNILGAEGMGLYQLVFPVFALLLTISSGGIPSAIAIIVSQNNAQGKNSKNIFVSSLILLTVAGFILTVFLVTISKQISILQSNQRTQAGYIIIAPAIFFVSVISVFRGYYIGNKNMLPPAISQISEAVIKLSAGLVLARYFLKKGLEYAVMGSLLGITISEVITLIILFVMFERKTDIKNKLSYGDLKTNAREISKLAFPLTIGGVIIPLSLFFDSIVIINILNIKQSVVSSTIDYGLFSGTVSPLINLPVMLSLSLGIAVVPLLTEGKVFRDIKSIKEKCDMCLKLAMIIGVPFFLLFIFLAENIITTLYPILPIEHITTAAMLMRIEAINIIALSIGQITASILQSLGKITSPVKFLTLSMSIKIVLNLTLLPLLGIAGAAIASVVCFSFYAIVNTISLRNLIGKSCSMVKNGSVISLCGAIMSVTVFVAGLLLKNSWALWIIIPISVIAYVLSLFAIGIFTKKELQSLPMSNVWLKLNDIFRRNKNATT